MKDATLYTVNLPAPAIALIDQAVWSAMVQNFYPRKRSFVATTSWVPSSQGRRTNRRQ